MHFNDFTKLSEIQYKFTLGFAIWQTIWHTLYVFCFGTRKTRASGTNKLTGIGINSIEDRLREPNCPFVLFVGTKKMIKRKEFEEYISKTLIF